MDFRRVSSKQLRVVDDLIGAKVDEREILRKHKVKGQHFMAWLKDEAFLERLRERVDLAKMQREAVRERTLSAAMRKLLEITESDTKDVPVCIEIVKALDGGAKGVRTSEQNAKEKKMSGGAVFPSATMRKVRAILADARRKEGRAERPKAQAEGTDRTYNAND